MATIYQWLIGSPTKQHLIHDRYAAEGFNPNQAALTIALSVPMAWYLASHTRSKYRAWFYRSLVLIGTIAIIQTASRGGFIALGGIRRHCFHRTSPKKP
ncbi:MAG: hypothetical protein R3C68_17085 [Myxococcota bacterium]